MKSRNPIALGLLLVSLFLVPGCGESQSKPASKESKSATAPLGLTDPEIKSGTFALCGWDATRIVAKAAGWCK